MDIIKDDAAQTSAEMILLFGGIIVVVVAAALFYRDYLNGLGSITTGTDLSKTLNGINNLATKFQ